MKTKLKLHGNSVIDQKYDTEANDFEDLETEIFTLIQTYPLFGPLGTIHGNTPPTMAQKRVIMTIGTAIPILTTSTFWIPEVL